jgi:hypothetical protein
MLRARHTCVAAVIAVTALSLPLHAASTGPLTRARLRPQSPRVARWMSQGLTQSPTLRALAERVERGNVIVYLEIAHRLDPAMRACVSWMAAAPGARYVRVSLQPHLPPSEAIAMLAHELQHVVEIIDHEEVTSADTLAALYLRIGHRSGTAGLSWDTRAALHAGDSARLEVARGA